MSYPVHSVGRRKVDILECNDLCVCVSIYTPRKWFDNQSMKVYKLRIVDSPNPCNLKLNV